MAMETRTQATEDDDRIFIYPEYWSDGSLSMPIGLTFVVLDPDCSSINPDCSNNCVMENSHVGCRLMEVFSVQFVDYENFNLAELYGTVLLNCGCIPYVLFERFPGDPLPIDCNGFVKLTGPGCALDAYDLTEFFAFLWLLEDHVYRSDQNIHRLWNGIPNSCLLFCNKLLSSRWSTVFGSIQINFAVFTESEIAILEIKLLDWREKGNGRSTGPSSAIELFGEVTAWNKMITDKRAESYMFKRNKDECALVRPGETIPLSRCSTVCPVKSSVVFHVSLFHPSNNDTGCDDLIIDREVEVHAANKKEELVLESEYARILLNVTFKAY